MTFLAPWALAIGGLAVAGAVLLHLVARQRPAAYVLPTTRFIPDRRTLVSRVATRPRDLLLLALRLVLLLSAAAAFARPVLAPSRGARARLIVLDRSESVEASRAGIERARALLADGVPTRLIVLDSSATYLADAARALDSLARDSSHANRLASLSGALVAARRAGPLLGADADSVELVLVSPVRREQLDAATDSVRAEWPGRFTVVRVDARVDSAKAWWLDHAVGLDDPLGPSLRVDEDRCHSQDRSIDDALSTQRHDGRARDVAPIHGDAVVFVELLPRGWACRVAASARRCKKTARN